MSKQYFFTYFYVGANPSTEEGREEPPEEGIKQVIDTVDSFRLQPTYIRQKLFLAYLKVCGDNAIQPCYVGASFSKGYMKSSKR
jgi:Translationally controlled tumour protein